jgi:uncharacterized RDD family membrane protein YckC
MEAIGSDLPDRRGGRASEAEQGETDQVVMDPSHLTFSRSFADAPNRVVGYLIDAVVLTVLSIIGAIVISVVFGPVVSVDLTSDVRVDLNRELALANAVVGTLISLVYFVGTWRYFQGSPGQRLLRMRIGAEEDGDLITYGRGAVRWLFIGLPLGVEAVASTLLTGLGDSLLLSALVLWYLALLISTARNPRKQGLHDRAARTVVTKLARVVPWDGHTGEERGAVVR